MHVFDHFLVGSKKIFLRTKYDLLSRLAIGYIWDEIYEKN